MKLLVVCQHYYPENFQITPICEQLARDGYQVTVLTGLPNYPLGVVPEEYRHGHREEDINGVHVIRCYEVGRRKGPVWLGINYLSHGISSLVKAGRLAEDFDLVFVYQLSPVTMGLAGCRYARKHRVPLLLYCCDLWPESMKMYVHSERNPLFRVGKAISRHVYVRADRIATQSRSFISYLSRIHAIPEGRMSYLPAFADEKYLEADFTPEGEVIDFVFLGNLGIAQNLMAVLEAVRRIRSEPGFQVHFVGDGACLEEMKRYVKENGLEEVVRFYGRRPVEEMPTFYKLADACMVSLRADNETGYTLPSKVQGYMAAGKPILGMIDGSAKEVIEESGCGICVRAGDVEGYAAAMRDFIEHREKYEDCGRRGREYFRKNFLKDRFVEQLESSFADLKSEGCINPQGESARKKRG